MNEIDLRSIFFDYMMTNLVCLIVIIILWHQSHKRFDGTNYLVLDYTFQVLCLAMIFLRGHIPDFLSIDVANTLAVTGAVMGFIGLEYFTGKRSIQIHNYLFIAVFFAVHTYFTFVEPDLKARNLNSAVAYLFIATQSAWLMLKRVPENLRNLTRNVGIVFLFISIVNVFRIVEFFITNDSSSDYFNTGSFETFVIVTYQILFIFLTFSLVLMINKRLFGEIATQEEKFSTAFHSVPYAIIITRLADGRILEVNHGFERITNYLPADVVGQTTPELHLWASSNDRDAVVDNLKKKIPVKEMEFLFRKKTGELMMGQLSSEIISVNNEKCVLSVISDITERKIADMALKDSELRLQELNATKDKFFSIIAHDLRSPFSSFLGLTQIMAEDLHSLTMPQLQEIAVTMSKSASNLHRLLENLLQWSQIQKGALPFNPEVVNLNSAVNDNLAMVIESAQNKGIEITTDIPEGMSVFADSNLLQTIIRNLSFNAIKYTHTGGKVNISARNTDIKTIEISIHDTGIGMSQTIIDNLFRIDIQHNRKGTSGEPSTGLGLILCKEFIEKHGGKIWVESEVGKGSIFYFSIPCNSEQES